jgi:gamma-tubulin complex component 2
MNHFIQSYITFTTTEVLEPRWHAMDAAIRCAKTIDEVVALHDRFLDSAMKGCLLMDIKARAVPHNIIQRCSSSSTPFAFQFEPFLW